MKPKGGIILVPRVRRPVEIFITRRKLIEIREKVQISPAEFAEEAGKRPKLFGEAFSKGTGRRR